MGISELGLVDNLRLGVLSDGFDALDGRGLGGVSLGGGEDDLPVHRLEPEPELVFRILEDLPLGVGVLGDVLNGEVGDVGVVIASDGSDSVHGGFLTLVNLRGADDLVVACVKTEEVPSVLAVTNHESSHVLTIAI